MFVAVERTVSDAEYRRNPVSVCGQACGILKHLPYLGSRKEAKVAKKTKNIPVAGMDNIEYAQAMLGLRQSNAAGKHADKRDKRARTRSAQKMRALRDW